MLASILLGHRIVGYVEYDEYCQKVIRQRIRDGIYDDAPIFGDIRRFDGRRFAGCVDVISGGFPCQAFSVAGRRLGEGDERNMWPETLRVIGEVRPRYCFLENVPGLISSGYFGTILGGLAESGYDAEWCVLGADDVGAPHRRKRLWILAYTPRDGQDGRIRRGRGISDVGSVQQEGDREVVAHTGDVGRATGQPDRLVRKGQGRMGFGECGADDMAHSERPGLEGDESTRDSRPDGCATERCTWWDTDPADVGDTECMRELQSQGGESDKRRWAEYTSEELWRIAAINWAVESELGGMVDGLASGTHIACSASDVPILRVATGVRDRVNRLKAIGNGQVPLTAAAAWCLLMKRIDEN